jgi:hypothetical protein
VGGGAVLVGGEGVVGGSVEEPGLSVTVSLLP